MTPDGSAPIFILGVPRSGTTLLRTILDSHPAIACGPETPWLGGHQPRSVMELWRFLREDRHGYVASYGMPPELVTAAAREFVDRLLSEYARSRGKRRWAEKTPDNALYVPFLLELFPDAKVIHLVRDGLDTAASTCIVEEHRKGISKFHENHLGLGPGVPPVPNEPFTAVLRWRHWNRLIERSTSGRQIFRIRYEHLVTRPEATLRALMDYLGETFEPSMLEYARFQHDYPEWEWGSADVAHRPTIARDRVGRGRRELDPLDLAIVEPLAAPTGLANVQTPAVTLARVEELTSGHFARFMERVNGFAGPLGLQQFTNWSKVWEYPWLWLGKLDGVDWAGAHLIDLGSALSPLPWVCAMLGAKVTMIETRDRFVPIWANLRDRLRLDVDWRMVDSESIPLPDASVDVVTSFSVVEHQADKQRAVGEAVRILKPGGLLAMSFDICEPEMGMTFPEWNGRALTLREFEDLVWLHPAFGNTERPAWNLGDIPAFIEWHRQGAPHHNYTVGAAILRKQR